MFQFAHCVQVLKFVQEFADRLRLPMSMSTPNMSSLHTKRCVLMYIHTDLHVYNTLYHLLLYEVATRLVVIAVSLQFKIDGTWIDFDKFFAPI